MQTIIYENTDKTLEIITPSIQALQMFDNKVIGEKSTPLGLPFWIVAPSVMPSSDRDAWRLDGTQGIPDGFGKKE